MPRLNARELEQLRLPDLQQRYREVVGLETRCPNRTFLIRKILEQAASTPAPARTAEPLPAPLPQLAERTARARRPKPARRPRAASGPKPERGRFSSMTVAELQTQYISIIGRPTGSTDRAYLIWKIREAEKGRVPIGPRETRRPDHEAKLDQRVLPLRLETESVAALDRAWRAQGLKSRMELFRRALGHYLTHIGAHAAAALFSSAEPQ